MLLKLLLKYNIIYYSIIKVKDWKTHKPKKQL